MEFSKTIFFRELARSPCNGNHFLVMVRHTGYNRVIYAIGNIDKETKNFFLLLLELFPSTYYLSVTCLSEEDNLLMAMTLKR